MEKSIIQQLKEGLLNVIGVEAEPKKIPVIPKSKGVIVPKLKPVPTVVVGKNKNERAKELAKELAEMQKTKIAALSKRIAKVEQAEKKDAKRDAELIKQIKSNKRAIIQQQKLIRKQQRWVSFMLKKWEQKNEKELKRMSGDLRKKMLREQKAYLRKLAQIRIKGKPVPVQRKLQAGKKKVIKHRRSRRQRKLRLLKRIHSNGSYRGRRFYISKRKPLRRRIRRLRPDRLLARLRQRHQKRRVMRRKRRIVRRHPAKRRVIRRKRRLLRRKNRVLRRQKRRAIRHKRRIIRRRPVRRRIIRRKRRIIRRPMRRRFFRRR